MRSTLRCRTLLPVILCAWALMLGHAIPSLAWGEKGHRIIAMVAQRHLTPGTLAAVTDLLGGGSLADVANWADSIRSSRRCTAPWHFIDIPFDGPAIDPARRCAPCGGQPADSIGCVVWVIDSFTHVLADAAAPRDARIEALKFLVHFIGDIHQPLHASDNHDRGGNEVLVTFFGEALNPYGRGDRPWNLHAVWDAGLIDHTGRSEEEYAALLASSITDADALGTGAPIDWAYEAHKLARDIVYGFPEGSARPEIGREYSMRCIPVVDMQMARAGLRLARMLNGIAFERTSPER